MGILQGINYQQVVYIHFPEGDLPTTESLESNQVCLHAAFSEVNSCKQMSPQSQLDQVKFNESCDLLFCCILSCGKMLQ